MSIALDADWLEPFDPFDYTHVAAAQRSFNFRLNWFAQPIFGDGEYPEDMRETLSKDGQRNGALQTVDEEGPENRLPSLSDEDKLKIKGLFIGILHVCVVCNSMYYYWYTTCMCGGPCCVVCNNMY